MFDVSVYVAPSLHRVHTAEIAARRARIAMAGILSLRLKRWNPIPQTGRYGDRM